MEARSAPTRCLIPRCGGTVDHHAARDALWARFFTAAPRTTEAVRRAIQLRQESVRALARRYGVSPTTVAEVAQAEDSTADARMGPKEPRSTVLTPEEEAIVVAFRRHTLLPLDDCLYGLQPTIPHLTRSSLHRCLERHGISRLPEIEGDKPQKKRFASYAIGYFHIDIAEVRTEEGKLHLFVAVDRTSKLAFAKLEERANIYTASAGPRRGARVRLALSLRPVNTQDQSSAGRRGGLSILGPAHRHANGS